MISKGAEEVRKLRAQGERMCVRRAELVVALPGAFQLRESEPCESESQSPVEFACVGLLWRSGYTAECNGM